MKLFRSVLFWTHLSAGVICGLVIFVMSFTGTVLALKPQIQNWIDRDVRYVTPQGQRLPPHALLTKVAANGERTPQSLALVSDPAVAASVGVAGAGNLYVNPYTGEVLGPQSQKAVSFFQSMTTWHRYMGAGAERRTTGRAATGISNLAFLLLGLTGLYIWWPKQLAARYLKPVVWFRRTATSRARDFNWHNTIGFWCLIPIVIMTASGAVISYPWATNLVYRLAGSPVPAARGAGPAGPAVEGAGRGRPGAAAAPGTESAGRAERAPRGREDAAGERRPQTAGEPRRFGGAAEQGPAVIPATIDALVATANQHVPTWEQLSLRLPNSEGGPVAFTIVDGAQWNDFARSQLTLNSATGEVVQWQPYEEQNRGQKLRGWLRFAHTGELGGLPGQIIAGIACAGGVVLVYTGWALAFRRLVQWPFWSRLRAGRRSRTGTAPASLGDPA